MIDYCVNQSISMYNVHHSLISNIYCSLIFLHRAYFIVWDLGFRNLSSGGLGFRVWGSPHSPQTRWRPSTRPTRPVVEGSGFRVQGSGFRVQGSGFRVQGSTFRDGG